MKKIEKICKSMNKINEDIVCFGSDYSFVIDGQSTCENGSSITKWYVKFFAKELKKNRYEKTLLECLNKTIESMNYLFKKTFPKEDIPSLSIALIRENNGKIEVLTIGNAKCLIKQKKVFLVSDDRMDKFEENILRKIKYISEKEKINILSARAKVNDVLNEKRKSVSTFKIVKDKMLTEKDVVYREFDYKKVMSALICTDGFYAYKDYLLLKDSQLYEVVENQGLRACYDHIRRMENKDKNLTSFPRLKLFDDASALYVSFY